MRRGKAWKVVLLLLSRAPQSDSARGLKGLNDWRGASSPGAMLEESQSWSLLPVVSDIPHVFNPQSMQDAAVNVIHDMHLLARGNHLPAQPFHVFSMLGDLPPVLDIATIMNKVSGGKALSYESLWDIEIFSQDVMTLMRYVSDDIRALILSWAIFDKSVRVMKLGRESGERVPGAIRSSPGGDEAVEAFEPEMLRQVRLALDAMPLEQVPESRLAHVSEARHHVIHDLEARLDACKERRDVLAADMTLQPRVVLEQRVGRAWNITARAMVRAYGKDKARLILDKLAYRFVDSYTTPMTVKDTTNGFKFMLGFDGELDRQIFFWTSALKDKLPQSGTFLHQALGASADMLSAELAAKSVLRFFCEVMTDLPAPNLLTQASAIHGVLAVALVSQKYYNLLDTTTRTMSDSMVSEAEQMRADLQAAVDVMSHGCDPAIDSVEK